MAKPSHAEAQLFEAHGCVIGDAGGYVEVEVYVRSARRSTNTHLTPDEARRLAASLLKVADEIEAQPHGPSRGCLWGDRVDQELAQGQQQRRQEAGL